MADIHAKIKLAREFGSNIQFALSVTDFRSVCDGNKAQDVVTICHSHDFCDSNMLMLEAFQTVFGRRPSFLDDMESEAGLADLEIWNDAWAIAKAAEFFA